MSDPVPTRRPGGRQSIPRPSNTVTEFDAPWELGASWTVAEIVDAVPAESGPLLPTFPDARHSAVLLLLADGPHGAEVLLTRRSMLLRNHRGEISFPGGRCDPGETPIETALRETYEEVGLEMERPKVVGELEHLSTIVSKSYIVPVVATLDERIGLSPQTAEADRVMWTPIAELTRPDTYHRERWGLPPLDRPLHFFHLDDETVWGATARILVDLLTLPALPQP
ncbi:NUDIX hydrolase [Ilumatobacter nonamiensis]|uniref:NUDIX hydrolase n=1 Tax=Ilumatobacter nonamiensis TaxID=467093 RepID=UPI0003473CF3|nr:CoA pyrophosphatase [Ilumatobacter nonamiensis]